MAPCDGEAGPNRWSGHPRRQRSAILAASELEARLELLDEHGSDGVNVAQVTIDQVFSKTATHAQPIAVVMLAATVPEITIAAGCPRAPL